MDKTGQLIAQHIVQCRFECPQGCRSHKVSLWVPSRVFHHQQHETHLAENNLISLVAICVHRNLCPQDEFGSTFTIHSDYMVIKCREVFSSASCLKAEQTKSFQSLLVSHSPIRHCVVGPLMNSFSISKSF